MFCSKNLWQEKKITWFFFFIIVFIRWTHPLYFCRSVLWYGTTPPSPSQTIWSVSPIFDLFMAFIDKNQINQCVTLLFKTILHSSLFFGSSMFNSKRRKKKENKKEKMSVLKSSLTVWSFTVTSSSLNKHRCNHTHPITLAFYWLQKYCYDFHSRGTKRKPECEYLYQTCTLLYIQSEGSSIYMLHTALSHFWGDK